MTTTSSYDKFVGGNPLHDVIIAGAGPVGLFLACELSLAGCSVLVLEKADDAHSSLKQLPFGIRGLSAPTIEALDRRGLLHELQMHKQLRNPHKTSNTEGPARQGGHFAGIPFHDGNVDTSQWPNRLPTSTATNLITTIAELESVLTRRAESLGVRINRGCAITGFQQTESDVRVHAGGKCIPGRWLVGCDGSRSVVRKAGGFEFAGTEPEFTGYSTQVDITDAGELAPGRNLTSTGMYFQSQPGYLLMLEFDGGAGHGAGIPTLEHVQEVLRRVSNKEVTINALHAATTWTDRARQTTSYRNGRVFLAGDAAHIHSPLGGQGLNLGMGDAMNLGWKLAATIHGNAPEGLLDSYHAERYPIGANVLDWSRAQVVLMKPDQASRALNAIVRDVMNTRDGATYFASRIWGILTHTDLGGNHPLTGYSVPNFDSKKGGTVGELLRDGKGVLLDFDDNDQLKTLASEYRITCASGLTAEQLDVSALLIRPDGIVACASNGEPDLDEFNAAAARWFTRGNDVIPA